MAKRPPAATAAASSRVTATTAAALSRVAGGGVASTSCGGSTSSAGFGGDDTDEEEYLIEIEEPNSKRIFVFGKSDVIQANAAFGAVYIARAGADRIIIKLFKPNRETREANSADIRNELRKNFEKEKENLELVHKSGVKPYVVEYLFQLTRQGNYLLGFEYLEGGDLTHLLAEVKQHRLATLVSTPVPSHRDPLGQLLPEGYLQRWMVQILLGLQSVDAVGYAYADAKPDNVVLDSRHLATANAVVIDLGLCGKLGFRTGGTSAFKPEEWFRKHEQSCAADAFGFALAILMLADCRGPQNWSTTDDLKQLAEGAPERFKTIKYYSGEQLLSAQLPILFYELRPPASIAYGSHYVGELMKRYRDREAVASWASDRDGCRSKWFASEDAQSMFSPPFRDFIRFITTSNSLQRPTLEAALQHPWLRGPARVVSEAAGRRLFGLPGKSAAAAPVRPPWVNRVMLTIKQMRAIDAASPEDDDGALLTGVFAPLTVDAARRTPYGAYNGNHTNTPAAMPAGHISGGGAPRPFREAFANASSHTRRGELFRGHRMLRSAAMEEATMALCARQWRRRAQNHVRGSVTSEHSSFARQDAHPPPPVSELGVLTRLAKREAACVRYDAGPPSP